MAHETSCSIPDPQKGSVSCPCTAPHEAFWNTIITSIASETTAFASLIQHIPGVYNSHEGITGCCRAGTAREEGNTRHAKAHHHLGGYYREIR